jgi:hypothetical protein
MILLKSVLPLDKIRRNTHTKKPRLQIVNEAFLLNIVRSYSFAAKELDSFALLAAFTIRKITTMVIRN